MDLCKFPAQNVNECFAGLITNSDCNELVRSKEKYRVILVRERIGIGIYLFIFFLQQSPINDRRIRRSHYCNIIDLGRNSAVTLSDLNDV